MTNGRRFRIALNGLLIVVLVASLSACSLLELGSVRINPTEASVEVGSTVQITARVSGFIMFDNGVTWKSSNESIATVDENGTVTGIRESDTPAVVTATLNRDETKSASARITVTKEISAEDREDKEYKYDEKYKYDEERFENYLERAIQFGKDPEKPVKPENPKEPENQKEPEEPAKPEAPEEPEIQTDPEEESPTKQLSSEEWNRLKALEKLEASRPLSFIELLELEKLRGFLELGTEVWGEMTEPKEPLGDYSTSLAENASVPIPQISPLITITCHVATWFYAAQTAQARGLSKKKTTKEILENISSMTDAPQQAILKLPQSGTWNLVKVPIIPVKGLVLVWENRATHSAIVTAMDAISGYIQEAQWPGAGFGYSTRNPKNINPVYSIAKVVLEETIVKEAGRRNL